VVWYVVVWRLACGEGCKDAEGRPTARARMRRTYLPFDLIPCPELFHSRFVCASNHRVRMRMRASSDGYVRAVRQARRGVAE
jgi:hypothetical protein